MDFSKPVVVLHHDPAVSPGSYGAALADSGLDVAQIDVWAGGSLPAPDECRAVVTLGGRMGAYEDDRLPWLAAERHLLARATEQGVPVWGVCLGAQLLATALGGSAYRGDHPELGTHLVTRAPDAALDPVGAQLPESSWLFQWHRDTFDLPEGARRLAGSARFENQAFAYGASYGVQFHAEVGAETIRAWSEHPSFSSELEREFGPGYADRVVELAAPHIAQGNALAQRLFTTWLNNYVHPQHTHQGVSV
ncbi:type 1 glutamine amidotransferase [Nocardioides sp. Bht2]|uniref:type 1 glutamine amidotransferase n=1 Tax=Nocardioides sp. Bht2 TaxID=3392297 RepID=UPI0039B384BC